MRGNEGRLALCLLLIVSWSEAPSWSADPLPTTEADTAEGEEGLAPDSPFVARQVETWLGDLEGLRERRRVRALVVQSRTGFFIERGQPRGFEVDLLEAWEDRLNAGATRRDRRVQVVYVPVTVEELIPSLLAGRGDIAAAGITVTDARRQQVAFSAPYLRDVDELFVVSRSAPPVETTDDLAGRRVHVPRGTSFAAHLAELSAQLVARGLQPIEIVEVDPRLDVEDLIEMVHAGIFEITVADEQVALLWARVLNGIVVREDLSLRDGGEIAWAVRPDSRELRASLDAFVNQNRRGSLLGNILFRRYFVDTRWIRNPVDADGLATFDRYGPLIRRYADQYHLDWLKLAALAYQESGLRQDRVSPRGAVGLMQVLPTTAAYLGFPNPRNLDQNVHAGVKYVALLRTEVGRAGSPAPDAQYDFTLAAYNMGRGRLRQMRRQAGERGLDPDTWFDNVEIVTLERVGQEPVRYVANINKLYVAYSLAMHDRAERERKRRLHEEGSP